MLRHLLNLEQPIGYCRSLAIVEALGNTPRALEMHELYVQMRDSINDEENQRATIRFQFEQQALTDSLANEKEKALAQLEYENKLSRQRLQLGFTGGIGLLFAGLAVVLYRTNQLSHTYKTLKKCLFDHLVALKSNIEN